MPNQNNTSDNQITLTVQRTDRYFDILIVYMNYGIINMEKTYDEFQLPQMDNSKGILVNGRGPIWLYLLIYDQLMKLNVPWMAQFDPRERAGVIISPDNHKRIIAWHEFEEYIPHPSSQQTIAFLGPPHSGKSVFLYSLMKQLLERDFRKFNQSAFIIKGCPDGEGMWSKDVPDSFVKMIRYKNHFDQPFINSVINNIQNCKLSKSLLFVDCGGKPDDYNAQILKKCTHAVFVAPTMESISEWKKIYDTTPVLWFDPLLIRLSLQC